MKCIILVSSCNSENQMQLNMSEEKIIVTFLRCMPDFPYEKASFPRATLPFTAALLSVINFPLRAARGMVPPC